MADQNPFITTANPMQQVMVDPEAQALQRQKQYAAMLLQNSQQPQGQMIGNRYVAPSWTQQLNAALNPVIGGYMMKQADVEQQALQEKLRKETAKGLMEYNKLRYGSPEEATYGAGEEGPTKQVTTAAVEANPQAAFDYAMQHKSPLVNQMAMELLKPKMFNEGQVEQVYNPRTGKMEIVGQGIAKYHPPTHVDLGDKVMIQYPDGRIQYMPKAKSGLEGISQLGGLRGQFISETKPHVDTADAYVKVTTAPKTAAGDMSKIYGFMKILDPGTGVKEGEYATASNAGGISTKIQSLYNKALNGEKLTDAQRAEFDQAAGDLVKSQKDRYNRIEKHYSNIATKAGVAPDLIISNPYEGLDIKTTPQKSTAPTMQDVKGTGRFNPLKTPAGASQVIDFNQLPKG